MVCFYVFLSMWKKIMTWYDSSTKARGRYCRGDWSERLRWLLRERSFLLEWRGSKQENSLEKLWEVCSRCLEFTANICWINNFLTRELHRSSEFPLTILKLMGITVFHLNRKSIFVQSIHINRIFSNLTTGNDF